MSNDTQHNWLTFHNPRNGHVRIQACSYCGVARGFEHAIKKCVLKPLSEHKMYCAGWQVNKSVV